MYNFRNSKANVLNILKSPISIQRKNIIPSAEDSFTYDNAMICWVSAIFIDIKNSSELFREKNTRLAKMLRAFTSELITIFQDFELYNQIGIRGDCVYAIYSTPSESDVNMVFDVAKKANTFLKMFNVLLAQQGLERIDAGIGLGCDKELIFKAGRSGTGINDKIWIGKAIVDAANLSSVANRHGYKRIAMNKTFYSIVQEKNKFISFDHIGSRKWFDDAFYQCDAKEPAFNRWIDSGMKS